MSGERQPVVLRVTGGDATPEEVAAITAVLLAVLAPPAAPTAEEGPSPVAPWAVPTVIQAGAWTVALPPPWRAAA